MFNVTILKTEGINKLREYTRNIWAYIPLILGVFIFYVATMLLFSFWYTQQTYTCSKSTIETLKKV